MKFNIQENKVLKAGRALFNVQSNDELFKIYEGSGIGTNISNKIRKTLKKKYDIDNLRKLTDKDGLAQLPFSNFIGPGTDMDSALKAGPVDNGPASVKNSNNLSADEIAKEHDIIYGEAGKDKYSKEEKFKMIQDADAWMISEVEKLPSSKTKTLILKSLKIKYNAEKKAGRLFYGGGGFKNLDDTNYNKELIDSILDDKKAVGTFNISIKTREDKIKENLEIDKKEKDEIKASEIEATKPYSEADKSILFPDAKGFNYIPVDYNNKKKKYQYIVSFPKDPSIHSRPPIEYTDLDSITDISCGDEYIYRFPINKIFENEYSIDNFDDIILTRDGKGYKPQGTNNIISILSEFSKLNFNLNDQQKQILREAGFEDNEGFLNFQIKDKEIIRQDLKGTAIVDKNKRIKIEEIFSESSGMENITKLFESFKKLIHAKTGKNSIKYDIKQRLKNIIIIYKDSKPEIIKELKPLYSDIKNLEKISLKQTISQDIQQSILDNSFENNIKAMI